MSDANGRKRPGAFRRALHRVGSWFHDRAATGPLRKFIREHRVPPETGRSRKGWFYVFGQALLFVFLAQVVTGTALAMKYIASPDHAWQSLRFINEEVAWGAFVRGLHFYGASAMVLLVFVHMSRVVLTGSYKFPRELNWITGVGLLFLTLAMAFTGQLLRWDQDGISTVLVAATMLGRFPVVGPQLMELVLAGDTVGGATLSRYFALHVIVVPLLMFGLIGAHVYLVLRHGVSEPPRPGEPVDRATYRSRYRRLTEEGETTYWPYVAWRELVFVLFVYSAVFLLALAYGPSGPGPPPDPALLEAVPRPDWYFLWYYALIWYKPVVLDALVLVWFPVLVFPALALLPLLFSDGERAPTRRPWALFAVLSTFVLWAALTLSAVRSDWIPDFATEPVSEAALEGAPPGAREGAALFHERGCQFCHVALGTGGTYGPNLDRSALQLPRSELTVRIMTGIGNMPAYRDLLSPGEVDALLDYIVWAAGRQAAAEEDR